MHDMVGDKAKNRASEDFIDLVDSTEREEIRDRKRARKIESVANGYVAPMDPRRTADGSKANAPSQYHAARVLVPDPNHHTSSGDDAAANRAELFADLDSLDWSEQYSEEHYWKEERAWVEEAATARTTARKSAGTAAGTTRRRRSRRRVKSDQRSMVWVLMGCTVLLFCAMAFFSSGVLKNNKVISAVTRYVEANILEK